MCSAQTWRDGPDLIPVKGGTCFGMQHNRQYVLSFVADSLLRRGKQEGH